MLFLVGRVVVQLDGVNGGLRLGQTDRRFLLLVVAMVIVILLASLVDRGSDRAAVADAFDACSSRIQHHVLFRSGRQCLHFA